MSSTAEMCVFVRLSVESPEVQGWMCCLMGQCGGWAGGHRGLA